MRGPWPRLVGLVQYAKTFNDLRSIAVFRRLMNDPTFGDKDLQKLRLRALGGKPLFCRPHTSDVSVLFNTFFAVYHLPPANVGPVRSILDLGSNIGTTMAHYANIYPKARILGVELDPENVEMCRLNIAPYADRCEILLGAVWNEDGQVRYGGDSEWGYHIDATAPRTSRAYSMDSLIGRLGGEVDFVKMDVEGAEKEILGVPGSWVGKVRCLKVEVHEPFSVPECMRILGEAGFSCCPYTHHHASVVAVRESHC